MIPSPLAVEIRPGAIDALAPLMADRRISAGGHVAVVVGPGLGEEIAAKLAGQLPEAEVKHVDGGSVETAMALAKDLRGGFYDAIVGIGGGRTLDTAKYASSLSGLPLVAVATSLAHDGIASPVSSLYEDSGRKTSIGVQMPIAVVVDLDYVGRSAPEMRRSGVGDTLSNLSAIADWRLAGRERGEEVDGVAVTFAQTAALAILHRSDSIDDAEFLMALADALVLSGLAMATAGSSRPCSGSDHEIVHAIDHLFPKLGRNHGELAGAAALFTTWLRGDERVAAELNVCLVRHGLPRTPADLGLSEEQFAAAVLEAPNTRPDRYTILEHLDLDEEGVRSRVRAFLAAFGR
jgi:glycerol-1-phosphate dehydrogenase [NAD(P)+]